MYDRYINQVPTKTKMKTSFSLCVAALSCAASVQGFVTLKPARQFSSSLMTMSSSSSSSDSTTSATATSTPSRLGFLQGLVAQAVGVGVALNVAPLVGLGMLPAQAASLSKVNSELAGYGFPPILDVPGGFTPLVEVYGKAVGAKKARDTVLVQFLYPSLWVVSRPSVDKNGEEGTISAGDYQKGDSAAFFIGPAESKLDGNSAASLGDVVVRAITQKQANVYQNFKVLKKREGPKGLNGQQYYIVEYKYELITGVGFTVDRKGVASVTQLGNNVEALVVATTAARWKKLGDDLITMADSFRVYTGVAPA